MSRERLRYYRKIFNDPAQSSHSVKVIEAIVIKQEEKLSINQGSEMAWLLGALVVRGSRIRDYDKGEDVGVAFTTKDRKVLDVVHTRGQRLLRVRPKQRVENVHPKLFFNDRAIAQELGDFSGDESVKTILEHHTWVLDKQYIKDFASGVLDAIPEKVFSGRKPRIRLHTESIEVARFYRNMFIRLGVKGAHFYYKDAAQTQLHGVAIRNLPDLRRVAGFYQSVNPDIQFQVDQLKRGPAKRKKSPQPSSMHELFSEWNKLRADLGDTFSAETVDTLYDQGKTRFSSNVYTVYVGKHEEKGKRSTFARAREVFTSLASLPSEDAEKSIVGMLLTRRKISQVDILTEWKKNTDTYGEDISWRELAWLHETHQTPYHPRFLAKHFGHTDDGGKNFPRARERLNELKVQVTPPVENQIFP